MLKKNILTGKFKLLTFSFLSAVFFLMFVSCPNPFLPDFYEEDYGIKSESSSSCGSFRLVLSSSRTVFPETPSLSYFKSFELIFTHDEDGELAPFYPAITDSALEPVVLKTGTYSLLINAYNDPVTRNSSTLAARGEASGIIIEEGKTRTREVTLKTIYGQGFGSLSWDIKFQSGIIVTEAEMTITDSSGGAVGSTVDILTNSSGSIPSLASGSYTAVFSVRTNIKELVWKELIHVYSTLDSLCDLTFEDRHFNTASYTVTVHKNDGTGGTQVQTYLHGEKIGFNDFNLVYAQHSLAAYCTDSALLNIWDLNKELTGNLTLYAKWLSDQGINVVFAPANDNAPQLALVKGDVVTPLADLDYEIIIYKPGDAARPGEAEIRVTNASEYSGIVWYVSSFTGNIPTGKPAVLASGSTVVFDSDNPRYNMDGNKLVTVEGIKNGVTYTSYAVLSVLHLFTATFFDDNENVYAEQGITDHAVPLEIGKTISPSAGLYLDSVLFDNNGEIRSSINVKTQKWRRKGQTTPFDFSEEITENISFYPYWETPVTLAGNLVEGAFTYVNTAVNAAAGAYTLLIDQNYNVANRSLSATGAQLTIRSLGDKERIIQASVTGSSLFSLSGSSSSSNISLTLEKNITLRGSSGSSSSLVSLSYGTLNMNAGSKITGHTTSSASGAVSVSTSGVFNLYEGAVITGNRSTSDSGTANGGLTISSGTANIYGSVTGNFRNTNIPSDIYNSVLVNSANVTTSALRLYGTAQAGVIKLHGAAPASTTTLDLPRRSVVGIYDSPKTTETVLDIFGAGTNMIDAVTNIEGKQYIIGNGFTLNAASVNNFKPGNILSNDGNSMPLSYMHYINPGHAGLTNVIGRVFPKNAQKPVVFNDPANEISYIFGEDSIKDLEISVFINDDGNLAYSAAGNLSFVWYRNTLNRAEGGTPVPQDTSKITTTTPNSGYRIITTKFSPDITELGTYYYYCVITNTNPNASGENISTQKSGVTSITMYSKEETSVYAVYDNAPTPNDGISGLPAGLKHEKFKDLENAMKLLMLHSTPADYTLYMTKDQALTASASAVNSGTARDIRVTLKPKDVSSVTISSSASAAANRNLFTIGNRVTLVLEDGIVLNGNSLSNSNPLVLVNSGGTLEMKNGSEIRGNNNTTTSTSNASYGGGVRNNGTFNMTGGLITGNSASRDGAGVYNSGTFIMSGGSINANSVSSAVLTNTNFTTYNGGGVFNSGAVHIGGSAKITGNTAGGRVNNLFLNKTTTASVSAGPVSVGTNGTGAPSAGMNVGVSVPLVAVELNPYISNISLNAGSSEGFYPDHADFDLNHSGSTLSLKLKSDVSYLFIDMYSTISNGWTGATGRIVVNAPDSAALPSPSDEITIYTVSKTSSTTMNTNYYRIEPGNTIQIYWVNGSSSTATTNGNCAFIAYFVNGPPNPAFTPAAASYTGSNPNIHKRNSTVVTTNGRVGSLITVP